MLRTRVLTALVIAALLIPAIYLLDRQWWAMLTAVIAGVGAWEFARLARFCNSGQLRYGAFMLSLTLAITTLASPEVFSLLAVPALAISALFWLFVAPLWLRSRHELKNHLLLALLGVVLLLPTWFALIVIREFGPGWLIGAILLVAFADIAAYFFGRAFGKRKLAPNISPGKTWEGAWGAMATVTGATLITALHFNQPAPVLVALAFGMPVLTLVSIAGDLLESMLKRQAGLKDSSNLLPGHGGVLDRIDSHTAALPFIALLLLAQRGIA